MLLLLEDLIIILVALSWVIIALFGTGVGSDVVVGVASGEKIGGSTSDIRETTLLGVAATLTRLG